MNGDAGEKGRKPIGQRVADHYLIWFLSTVLASFVAGVKTYDFFLQHGYLNKQCVDKDQTCIGSDRMQTLLRYEWEAQHPRPVPSAAKPEPAPGYLTELTQEVESFVDSTPQADYQWEGYKNDVKKLKGWADGFLNYLDSHHNTKYDQAQTFYSAMYSAAIAVAKNAQQTFNLEKESSAPVCRAPNDPVNCVDLRTPYYNQKVYIGPAQFAMLVEELRQDHKGGTSFTPPRIKHYRDELEEWKSKEGI
jgi:hypothetical protein